MERRVHRVFDRCHGESVEKFEAVKDFEIVEETLHTDGFQMSAETTM